MPNELTILVDSLTADQRQRWDAMRDRFLDIMDASKARRRKARKGFSGLSAETKADWDQLMQSEPDNNVRKRNVVGTAAKKMAGGLRHRPSSLSHKRGDNTNDREKRQSET
jgi:hypothetical protein